MSPKAILETAPGSPTPAVPQITLTQKQTDQIAALVKESNPGKSKLIRLPSVLARVPYSRPSLYRLIKLGKFPRPIALGGGRAVAWYEHSIDEWIAARESSQQHAHI
jgi:prophage regulatory protein